MGYKLGWGMGVGQINTQGPEILFPCVCSCKKVDICFLKAYCEDNLILIQLRSIAKKNLLKSWYYYP